MEKEIQKRIEKLEHIYMVRITYHLRDFFADFITGLNSRIYFKNDWFDLFNSINVGSREKSDLDKGAERIIHHIYAFVYKRPLSVPIGADLMYETYDAVVHIDVKTISVNNISDYRKINLERTQTSYSNEWFKAALPPIYTKTELLNGQIKEVKKPCLTYVIYILHEIGKENVSSVLIVNVPNGLLRNLYGDIIQSGKSGKEKGHNARFSYEKFIFYKTIPSEYRVVFLYKDPLKTQRELIGFEYPKLPVLIEVKDESSK